MKKNERNALLSILGGVVNTRIKYLQAKNEGKQYTLQDGVTDFCWGTAVTLVGTVAITYSWDLIFNPKNTIIYRLYDGDKHVYTGITYAWRRELRCKEHLRDGKKFTRMVIVDVGILSRTEALKLEKKDIKQSIELGEELYNVHHIQIDR